MISFQLKRRPSTDQGTFGVLAYEDKFLCYAGELPWRDNKQQISCIPPGTYIVEPWNSKRFPNTYHLKDVQGRSAILTHQGNLCGDRSKGYLSHVLGCIIVGDKRGTIRGQQAVLLSVVGFFIKRWMDNLENQIKAVCTEVDGKIDKSECKDFRANEQMESNEVWNWLKYHSHDANGSVVVPKRT